MIAITPAVEINNLSVAYHGNVVLDSIDLSIRQQTVMGLIGPNGAGKSTLLKSVLDLVPRQSGEVSFFGRPFSADRKQVGYVAQRTTIDWDFPITVGDLVTMGSYGRLGWIRRPGRQERMRTAEALERLGIEEFAKRQIGELSGGQQQRAFLARAFVQDAPIYFLDEPFNGVDMTTEQTIVELLHQMRDAGKTIVIVQHDLSTVGEYLDEVTLVNRQIVASGRVADTFTTANIEATYHNAVELGHALEV